MNLALYLTAKEIAEAGVRLKLKALPHSKRGVQDHIDRYEWATTPLCRKRSGSEGGGGNEYHISLLPEALQSALQAEHSREVVMAAQQQQKARELARREALSTVDLTARQREVMTARSAILTAIERYQISNGLSQRQAIDAFLVHPAGADIMDHILVTANDRGNESRDLSMRTIQRWFATREKAGIAGLAPLPTKEKQDMPEWFWSFLWFYAKPQKPCLSEALENYKQGLPAHIMPPHYDQVRRLMARLGNVERHRGREGSQTLKARMAYTMRSTADLLATCIYTADGKTFDAEVAHPIHGQPFRPEITSVVDVATRRCVGFSIGLAENSGGVVDALRHACEQHGIPAIFYVDRGPGFRNELLDNQLTGLTERIGITKLHSLPYNSQARGIIERFNGSVWNRLARSFQTYIGDMMDRQAKQRVFKETRRDLKQIGTSAKLPTFMEFLESCRNAIADYNDRSHSELPGKMSPNQYWEYQVSTGLEAVPVLEHEKDDLFRPYVKRKVSRSMVEFLTNFYFHLGLEEFHGDHVLVGYDIHDGSKVWVREIDRSSGEELMGRSICVAIFAGNEERYIPLTMERAAMEKRATTRAKRLHDKLAVVEAELSPGRFLEQAAERPMPLIIDATPEPMARELVLVTPSNTATGAVESPRRRTFASDEALAAWALENPDDLTSNQVRVLRQALNKASAIELFRLSGIDVDALRNLIRAAA
ncbi:Mu transposase C-terminal domain-containing protein [Rhizobium sp. 11_C7_N12_5]|uniref:Mu transposase C-terminal domain-containing protein n=1 Tax=Rhizobium sp. 11_C7_N12_5 TaxID=3240770 RepID=UPI003F2046AD